MADTASLLTSRRICEEAVKRIVSTYVQGPVSGWQIVSRFFRGKPAPARISIIAGDPQIETQAEDLTPALVSVPVRISARSHVSDSENADGQDDATVQLCSLTADAAKVGALLDAVMAADYADSWCLKLVVPELESDCRIEDKTQVSVVTLTLWIIPPELVLADKSDALTP